MATTTPETTLEDLPVDAAPTSTAIAKKKKSRFGSTDIFRAAMIMIGIGSRRHGKRGGSSSQPKEPTTTADASDTANSTLKLVGSVRPLYGSECVPENSPPRDNQQPESGAKNSILEISSPPGDYYQPTPASPLGAEKLADDESSYKITEFPPPTGVEEGMLSAVSSAYWLVNDDGTPEMLYPPPANAVDELQTVETNDDHDTYYDGIQGDEKIDAKAEEFITQFYQQMRNQGSTPVDRG